MIRMSYPLLDVFLTMMWFFLWVLWIYLLIRVIADIFRSRGLGGWAKAGWPTGKDARRRSTPACTGNRTAALTRSPSSPTCMIEGLSATPTISAARTGS
jgi:hypothetical protein